MNKNKPLMISLTLILKLIQRMIKEKTYNINHFYYVLFQQKNIMNGPLMETFINYCVKSITHIKLKINNF